MKDIRLEDEEILATCGHLGYFEQQKALKEFASKYKTEIEDAKKRFEKRPPEHPLLAEIATARYLLETADIRRILDIKKSRLFGKEQCKTCQRVGGFETFKSGRRAGLANHKKPKSRRAWIFPRNGEEAIKVCESCTHDQRFADRLLEAARESLVFIPYFYDMTGKEVDLHTTVMRAVRCRKCKWEGTLDEAVWEKSRDTKEPYPAKCPSCESHMHYPIYQKVYFGREWDWREKKYKSMGLWARSISADPMGEKEWMNSSARPAEAWIEFLTSDDPRIIVVPSKGYPPIS